MFERTVGPGFRTTQNRSERRPKFVNPDSNNSSYRHYSSLYSKTPKGIFVQCLAIYRLTDQIVEEENVTTWVRESTIEGLAKIKKPQALVKWMNDTEFTSELPMDQFVYPLYIAKKVGEKCYMIISRKSYRRLTRGDMHEIVTLLKYNPIFGAEMLKAQEHFEEENIKNNEETES